METITELEEDCSNQKGSKSRTDYRSQRHQSEQDPLVLVDLLRERHGTPFRDEETQIPNQQKGR